MMACRTALLLALVAAVVPPALPAPSVAPSTRDRLVPGQTVAPYFTWAAPLLDPGSRLGGASAKVDDLAVDSAGAWLYATGKVFNLCYSQDGCDQGAARDSSTSTDFGWEENSTELSHSGYMMKARCAPLPGAHALLRCALRAPPVRGCARRPPL
jgi:hypothetical protein